MAKRTTKSTKSAATASKGIYKHLKGDLNAPAAITYNSEAHGDATFVGSEDKSRELSDFESAVVTEFTNNRIRIDMMFVGITTERGVGFKVERQNWMFSISHTDRKDKVTTYRGTFSVGAECDIPSPLDVVTGVISDGECAQGSYGDFCDEFGYDADSRAHRAIYKACREARKFIQGITSFAVFAGLER